MHYPLKAIHDLVYHSLQPVLLIGLEELALSTLWEKAYEITKQVGPDMLQSICSVNSKKGKRTLVQSYQVAILTISNQLHEYSQLMAGFPLTDVERRQQIENYRQLRNLMVNNLDVLDYFPDCTRKKLPLPDNLYEQYREKIQLEWSQFEQQWKKKIDQGLLERIVLPVHDFINHEQHIKPAYSTGKYLVQLLGKIQTLLPVCPPNANRALLYLLISENFNHPHFISYALEQCHPAPTEEGMAGDLQLLYQWKREMKRLPFHTQNKLYPDRPSCRKMMLEYIEQEIQLLEHERTFLNQQRAGNLKAEGLSQERLTIKTKLSITELGHILKSFVDAGLLHGDPLTELFSQVARNIATVRSNEYSARSLNTAFYAQDPVVKRKLVGYLIEVMNELKK